MASNTPNMKVSVSADTSNFQKGMRDSKAALRDFDRTSKDALGKLGDALGVDLGKFQQYGNAVKGAGRKLQDMGVIGKEAFAKLSSGVTGVAGAIAGLGIAAAAVEFKRLREEAEYFKTTVEGANLELMTTAYIDTYRAALHDFNQASAENFAQAESSWKKFWKTLRPDLRNLRQGLALGGTTGALVAGLQNMSAEKRAERASQISNELYQIDLKRVNLSVTNAKLDAQIAEYRRIAADQSEDLAARSEAIANAEELTRQKYDGADGIVALEQRAADLLEERNQLTSSTPAQIKEAADQRVRAINLETSEANELRALLRLQNTINAAVEKQAQAERDAAAQISRMNQLKSSMTAISGLGATIDTSGAKPALQDGIKIPAKIVPVIDQEALDNGAMLMTSAFESMGNAIGGLVGDLVTGGDAFENFTSGAIGALGDMAIQVGKIAIAEGVAMEAIKLSFKSLGGVGAMAAGAALIALGTAVKSGLANISSGSYSAAPSVASSGYTRAALAGQWEQGSLSINVTGKLVGQGSQLVAVIDNEEKRKAHTT